MSTPAIKIPAITELIESGYGQGMLGTIIESLRWLAISMKADGYISDTTEAHILNLLMLEEAVLEDCFGIDIHKL